MAPGGTDVYVWFQQFIYRLFLAQEEKEILDVYEDSTLITTPAYWLWGFDVGPSPAAMPVKSLTLPGCTILIATIPMAPSGAVQWNFLSES